MVRAALVLVAAAAFGAVGPAPRPDGDPPGHGSQRLGVEALRYAHSQFSGDACLGAIDASVLRVLDPKWPAQDQFTFAFRSPSLSKVRFEARVCLPVAEGAADPRCHGEWELSQPKVSPPAACLPGRPADSGEALLIAERNGLPKPPVDGLRLVLRAIPKKGKGLARHPKLKGKTLWLIESRDVCYAVDAGNLKLLHKGPCAKLGSVE